MPMLAWNSYGTWITTASNQKPLWLKQPQQPVDSLNPEIFLYNNLNEYLILNVILHRCCCQQNPPLSQLRRLSIKRISAQPLLKQIITNMQLWYRCRLFWFTSYPWDTEINFYRIPCRRPETYMFSSWIILWFEQLPVQQDSTLNTLVTMSILTGHTTQLHLVVNTFDTSLMFNSLSLRKQLPVDLAHY